MKAAVIINPAAGPFWSRRPTAEVEASARAMVAHHSGHAWVVFTHGPGHARDLAREAVADGAQVVIAWGGDGTVNEVASALVYGRAALGVVRVGSGNGLARELGIPADPDAALEVALTGAERVIDVGELNGRLFFNVAGIGFDAHVAEAFARSAVPVRGFASYAAATMRELLHYRAHRYVVTADGENVADDAALLVSMANTRQWGNGAIIAPGATMDDGRLDLVFARSRHPVFVAANIWRLFWGDIADMRGVRHRQFSRATIQAFPPAPVHTDGEVLGHCDRIEIAVRAQALRVRVPA
ncbi:MAG: diacylglycerol kinase family lipid kinase [Acidobacteria bacterium]|nr:diacylglycerol kinase family lipid kinase [Acidobacteriota bacterium]